MTLLTKITNEAINENLQKRWSNAEIYTYIGHVLISVNPFRDLGIYTDDILNSYKGKNLLEVSIQKLVFGPDYLLFLDASSCFRYC